MPSKKQRAQKAKRRRRHEATTRTSRPDPLPAAINELKALAKAGSRVLDVRQDTVPDTNQKALRVTLGTSDIVGVERGFPVADQQEFYVVLSDRYPDSPAEAYVHDDPRFLGYPHVICGRKLCVYLDPQREWNPTYGMEEFVNQVWCWFDDAANDRFDPRTSLFHAVGGATPVTSPVPMIVVRESPPAALPLSSRAALVPRAPARIDVAGWRRPRRSQQELPAAIFHVPTFLPRGLARTVGLVAAQIELAKGLDARSVATALQGVARASPRGQPAYLGLVVEHPTEREHPAVVMGMIPAEAADRIRQPDPALTPAETPIEWIPVSDERTSITTPRDTTRPASGFRHKTIEMWGCGGLGSWCAEFLTRAHPEKVVLRDTGQIHGGHLVRQNYTEKDVGGLKVEQLAERLRAISDTTEIVVGGLSALDAIADGSSLDCDLVIDATINETVAHHLDQFARGQGDGLILSQIATDRRSGTLGLIVVAEPSFGAGPATIDRQAGASVLEDASLEAFHEFWTPPAAGAELVPARGCSVPTYHGSAADLASVTGSMVSILGQQLTSPVAGVHLIAAPHSGCGPPLTFIPHARP